MAFLPGIFGKQAAPQQAATQQQPAQPAPQPAAGPVSAQMQGPANPAANPAAMQNQQAAPAAGGPVNPLDSFADMFKPKPVDPNAPKAPTLADPILGQLDPAAFRQQVEQANFAASIPQETIQRAISGDAQALSLIHI